MKPQATDRSHVRRLSLEECLFYERKYRGCKYRPEPVSKRDTEQLGREIEEILAHHA